DRAGTAVRRPDGTGCRLGLASVPVGAGLGSGRAAAWPYSCFNCAVVRYWGLYAGCGRHVIDLGRTGAPIAARATQGGRRGPGRHRIGERCLMELIYAAAIGVMSGSGVWLILRPRPFQVIIG